LHDLVGQTIQFISTGEPVARQTRRLLQSANDGLRENRLGQITMGTTGQAAHLKAAAEQWLYWQGNVESLLI